MLTPNSVKGSTADGGEGDILEQWRRRRKVEEMRSRVDCGETASKSAAAVVSGASVSKRIVKLLNETDFVVATTL